MSTFKRLDSSHKILGHTYEEPHLQALFGNKFLTPESLLELADNLKINLHYMKQVHSPDVHLAPTTAECDGLFTLKENEALVVKTADCLPLMIAGKIDAQGSNTLVAALHCGRKGLLDGIIQNFFKLHPNFAPQTFLIGPHIHDVSYEIGAELHQTIKKEHPLTDALKILDNKFCFSLKDFTKEILFKHFPQAQIFELEIDTMVDQNYNSYRRDAHTSARNLSLIWKKGMS